MRRDFRLQAETRLAVRSARQRFPALGLEGGQAGSLGSFVVPTSLTWVSATMKINVGLALIGAITGEYLSSTRGLGYLAVKTANEYQMSHTLGVLLVIAVIAAAQYYLLGRRESRMFRWQADAGLVHIT